MVKETCVLQPSSQSLESITDVDFDRSKFYDLLEVPPNASEADLKKAYRKKYVLITTYDNLTNAHRFAGRYDYILTKAAIQSSSRRLHTRTLLSFSP